GRITLVRAVPAAQHEQRAGDPTLGWQHLAEGGVDMRTIRTNHVALLVKPYVEILAQELLACLDQSRSTPDRLSQYPR
ncbi:MAG TPA: hypothetical protein VFU63_01785, partial [Ktedonobacterales bacterium]|nr:hypothetical protein [Ktedonobacterales bacterium]